MHRAVVLEDVVGGGGPAAVAAGAVGVAGDDLLLGKVGLDPVVDLDEGFHLRRGGKRPAGAAVALVLHRGDPAHIAPVEVGRQRILVRRERSSGCGPVPSGSPAGGCNRAGSACFSGVSVLMKVSSTSKVQPFARYPGGWPRYRAGRQASEAANTRKTDRIPTRLRTCAWQTFRTMQLNPMNRGN